MSRSERRRNMKVEAWPDKPGFPDPPSQLVAYKEYNANVYDEPKIWRRSGIFRDTYRRPLGRPLLYYYAAVGNGVSRQYMTEVQVREWLTMPDVVVVNADLLPKQH
jgi:hypothetical protein